MEVLCLTKSLGQAVTRQPRENAIPGERPEGMMLVCAAPVGDEVCYDALLDRPRVCLHPCTAMKILTRSVLPVATLRTSRM